MTERQRRFADYYIETGTKAPSAIRAGYSKRSAHAIADETLKNPEVAQYIETRLAQMDRDRIASAEEVLGYLTRVMRGDEPERKIREVDGESVTVESPASIYERTRAAELLGKRHMLFTDRSVTDVRLGEMTPEDKALLERVGKRLDE